jgi:hypothetical protein
MMFKGLLTFYRVRVEWDYPNPNPKLRVPAAAGNGFLGLSSGSSFYYPNFPKPELPDPIGSGNPNAQSEPRGNTMGVFLIVTVMAWSVHINISSS